MNTGLTEPGHLDTKTYGLTVSREVTLTSDPVEGVEYFRRDPAS
jgi:hypothetical protein